ncbi:MAG: acetyl-CoA hydrolase, partial [Pseudonocardia sp.]|nr:acetyl-CoA hydrolase [Pseudonocardia sp.]
MADHHLDSALRELVRPGDRVALADACGTPYALTGPLSRVAAAVGGGRLGLGWVAAPLPDLDPTAFADVRTVVGGPGMRAMLDA